MSDLISIYPDAAVAVTEMVQPAIADWGRQPQFGMTFEEQQEAIYQALVSFEGPELQ